LILQQYIQDILFRQRTCCLPQVGTFTLHHIPARFDVADKTLTPPIEEVLFDEKWTDDGACLEWIALKEKLVTAVAQRKLDRYLTSFRAALQTGQPLDLPGIGQLRADMMGHITFKPVVLPTGQEVIFLQPVLRSDASYKVQVGTTEVVDQQVVEHLTPVNSDLSDYQQFNEESAAGFKWWWLVIPAAAAIIGFAIWFNNTRHNNTAVAAPSQAVATNQSPAIDTMHQQTAPAGATDSIATANHTVISATDSLDYFVVFAEYDDVNKAQKRFQQLKSWGHKVEMYSKDVPPYKLAVPSRSIAADTTKTLDAIRKFYGVKQVYLEF
jgi:nucleoid DNA-binding protein